MGLHGKGNNGGCKEMGKDMVGRGQGWGTMGLQEKGRVRLGYRHIVRREGVR